MRISNSRKWFVYLARSHDNTKPGKQPCPHSRKGRLIKSGRGGAFTGRLLLLLRGLCFPFSHAIIDFYILYIRISDHILTPNCSVPQTVWELFSYWSFLPSPPTWQVSNFRTTNCSVCLKLSNWNYWESLQTIQRQYCRVLTLASQNGKFDRILRIK